ncbi:hypothetical protein F4780DRAFT_676220 [Xylariomycetidae sp. FL0641]|nr:hypothetical protein F4780DRAFT_676220 [Xylariomycetidae sp. FL0641]
MASGAQAFYCLWRDEQIRERLFELLPKEDICNVRLANSACCNLVTKRLFLRTHLNFTASTFTRPARIQALARVGQHIEHLTFHFPHSDVTFLPPLVHPETGEEIPFLYKPYVSMASVFERPKFGSSGFGEILTAQYPPLFHAASNVPSFINAMRHLPNVRHLTIKTPGQDPRERYRRDIVDYALISLRISVERAPLEKLSKLTLSSVHPSAFIYLRHTTGFGCLPSAGKRWAQIKKLHISAEAWDFYSSSPGRDHLKIMQDYIYNFAPNLEKLSFNWLGRKGPCPIALAADPLFAPSRSSQKLFNEVTSPMSPLPPPPARKAVIFDKLRFLAMRNTTMNVQQVADLVAAHQHCVREFDFDHTFLIKGGSWNEALAPLIDNTNSTGRWTRYSTATIDEPLGLHPALRPEVLSGEEPEPSAAVAALADEVLNINLGVDQNVVEADDEERYGQQPRPEPQREEPHAEELQHEEAHPDEEVDLDLPSDVEASRQASVLFKNVFKTRRITKRRRKRKPGHEHPEVVEQERTGFFGRQRSKTFVDQPRDDHHHHHHRHHRHQRSEGSLKSHSTRRSDDGRELSKVFTYPMEPLHPSLMNQSSDPRLYGEIESIYSTTSSSRRLFGEITPMSQAGSEPDLSHSPTNESGSVRTGYFLSRPATPTTPTQQSHHQQQQKVEISAPILDTKPSMPTMLLPPTVYDPTAELCNEITAVQRDIEAEERQRLVAEDADIQVSALRRAKELVLNRLGDKFPHGKGHTSLKKDSFGGAGNGFLSSARFREGLFGKSTPQVCSTPTTTPTTTPPQQESHRQSMDVPILFSPNP